jgi:hypothetical protein
MNKPKPSSPANELLGTLLLFGLLAWMLQSCIFPSDAARARTEARAANELANEQVREIGRQMAADRDAWLPPTGFTLTSVVSDSRGRPIKAGLKWLEQGQYSCDYGKSCWGLQVVAIDPCQSMYAEIAVLSRAGSNIGMANDVAVGSSAYQRVEFVFNTFEPAARSADIVKITCH